MIGQIIKSVFIRFFFFFFLKGKNLHLHCFFEHERKVKNQRKIEEYLDIIFPQFFKSFLRFVLKNLALFFEKKFRGKNIEKHFD